MDIKGKQNKNKGEMEKCSLQFVLNAAVTSIVVSVANARLKKRRIGQMQKKTLKDKECVVCGKRFTPKQNVQKYCSKECSNAFYRQGKKSKPKVKQCSGTDWKAIGRLMKESGLSYGQLQARGMLEGMEVDKS